MSHIMTCGDAPKLHVDRQTWLCQPLPVSTVPNTGRNLSNLTTNLAAVVCVCVCVCVRKI